jgi:flavin prenyltransferase
MKRIVVGISGATGAIYGIRLLEELRGTAETHVVISPLAADIMRTECDRTAHEVASIATHAHRWDDLAAPLASGSFRIDGMVVAPCSMHTLSSIAMSHADNLLCRTADVALKERVRLVLAVRETPLHDGHLDLMQRAARIGAVICPPVPSFYHRPATVSAIVDFSVGRMLDLLGIEHALCARWGQEQSRDAT